MQFWKQNMPAGMFLRSGPDWHLDPLDDDTIDAFLSAYGRRAEESKPLSLGTYIEYALRFQEREHIEILPASARSLGSPYRRELQQLLANAVRNGVY